MEEYRREEYLLVKRIEELIDDQAASSTSVRRRFVEVRFMLLAIT